MKHLIYTDKSNISFEKYESNNDSGCSINCCSRSNDNGICCTRTTSIGMGRRLRRLWRLRRAVAASVDVASAAVAASVDVASAAVDVASAAVAAGATGTSKQLPFLFFIFMMRFSYKPDMPYRH